LIGSDIAGQFGAVGCKENNFETGKRVGKKEFPLTG
jgi:hypothetical protein